MTSAAHWITTRKHSVCTRLAPSLLRNTAELEPQSSTLLSNRAAALVKLQRVEEAIEDCKKAIEIEPKFARVHPSLPLLLL
jgi:Flp pilus assembly protein TadD